MILAEVNEVLLNMDLDVDGEPIMYGESQLELTTGEELYKKLMYSDEDNNLLEIDISDDSILTIVINGEEVYNEPLAEVLQWHGDTQEITDLETIVID